VEEAPKKDLEAKATVPGEDRVLRLIEENDAAVG